MYVSINEHLISFQRGFGVLSRPCQGKGQKTFPHFICLRGRHVVRVLQVEGAHCVGLFYLILCCLCFSDVLSCRILQCATGDWISASNAASATPQLVPLFVLDHSLYDHRPICQEIWPRVVYCTSIHISWYNFVCPGQNICIAGQR